jgi:hypothetical protein
MSLVLGVLALIAAIVAFIKADSLNKRVPANLPNQLASLASRADSTASATGKTNEDIVALTRSTQAAFDSIGPEIGNIKASVARLEEAQQRAEAFAALVRQRVNALTLPLRPPAGFAVSLGSGHWIETNADGEVITLEDGSIWKIDPLDQVDAQLWLETSEITVIESADGSPGYDYLLINTDDSEKAHARYIGQK